MIAAIIAVTGRRVGIATRQDRKLAGVPPVHLWNA